MANQMPISVYGPCKANQFPGKLILHFSNTGLLATYARISSTAFASRCLFTLEAKHFLFHHSFHLVIILKFFRP